MSRVYFEQAPTSEGPGVRIDFYERSGWLQGSGYQKPKASHLMTLTGAWVRFQDFASAIYEAHVAAGARIPVELAIMFPGDDRTVESDLAEDR